MIALSCWNKPSPLGNIASPKGCKWSATRHVTSVKMDSSFVSDPCSTANNILCMMMDPPPVYTIPYSSVRSITSCCLLHTWTLSMFEKTGMIISDQIMCHSFTVQCQCSPTQVGCNNWYNSVNNGSFVDDWLQNPF